MGSMSVATIKAPEFLNINSISPLISQCEIKVLYVGQNRNRSFISKEVAAKMAETLPGSPIVGMYINDKEDFLDHGERITIDGEGIKFEDMTKPYGFVAPDAKIWFQEFEDTDEFGNKIIREYLMTTGYLWTGQYEECKRIIEEGNPQSMKLNGETLKGHWSTDTKSGIEFFIINDATFENLCILGKDVEPCFEGADITAPKLSSDFSNENFMKSLFSMMEELKFTLSNKGGSSMEDNKLTTVEETNAEVAFEAAEEAPVEAAADVVVEAAEDAPTATESFEVEDKPVENDTVENEDKTEEFSKKEEEKEEPASDESDEDSEKEDEEDEKKKYELLESQYAELETKYNELQVEYSALVDFKNKIEEEKKDALINSFYMLSDEDKADVVAKKNEYSLEQIEEKLSVICVRKKVTFDLEEKKDENEEKEALTFNLDSVNEGVSVPAYITALRKTKESDK